MRACAYHCEPIATDTTCSDGLLREFRQGIGLRDDGRPRLRGDSSLDVGADLDPYLPKDQSEDARDRETLPASFKGQVAWDRNAPPSGPSGPSESPKVVSNTKLNSDGDER